MKNLIALDDSARVWIYTSKRVFGDEELFEVNAAVESFASKWTSHNRALKASGGILHNRFVLLFVDESKAGASGCSIDTSVHFLQRLEEKYQTDLFDRKIFTYLKDDVVQTVLQSELKEKYEAGIINDETLMFDNLVSNKGDFLERWVTPLAESWIKKLLR